MLQPIKILIKQRESSQRICCSWSLKKAVLKETLITDNITFFYLIIGHLFLHIRGQIPL